MMDYLQWYALRDNENRINFGSSNAPALTKKELKKLGIGVPKLDCGRVNHGGSWQLKETIAGMYGVNLENVAIGSGASNLNDVFLEAIAQAPTIVALESPTYGPLHQAVAARLSGDKWDLRRFSRKAGEHNLEGAVSGAGLVIATNLNNPTGSYTSPQSLHRFSETHPKTTILVDEVYRRFCDGLDSAYPLCPNAVVTDSMTKFFGATTLRIGWAVGPAKIIAKMQAVQRRRGDYVSAHNEEVARQILRCHIQTDYFTDRNEKLYLDKWDMFRKWYAEQDRLETVMPDGNMFCFPKVAGVRDTTKMCDYLLYEEGIFVVPGRLFGAPSHIRISFGAVDEDQMNEGLKLIEHAAHKYSKEGTGQKTRPEFAVVATSVKGSLSRAEIYDGHPKVKKDKPKAKKDRPLKPSPIKDPKLRKAFDKAVKRSRDQTSDYPDSGGLCPDDLAGLDEILEDFR